MLHEHTDLYVDLQITDSRRWKKNKKKKFCNLSFCFRPDEIIIKSRKTGKSLATITVSLDDSEYGNQELNVVFQPDDYYANRGVALIEEKRK